MRVYRYPENPLITPADVKPWIDGWQVMCAFNAGVIEHDGEILLLMRVAERPVSSDPDKVCVPVLDCEREPPSLRVLEFSKNEPGIDLRDPRVVCFPGKVYLTSISHLRIARSRDGRHFRIDPQPALVPDQPYETFGLEDPRITELDGTYYVVYKGVSENGITQCLASTRDFVTWQKHGIIFCPENMDGMIFPSRVRGKYVALHRPQPRFIGAPNMWIAYSEDLVHWGEHKLLLACDPSSWESGRIGGGAVPFLTDHGWLEIYHAATPDDHYCLGAVLLDAEYPERVLAKTPEPIMRPETSYETSGFKPNVVFTCGALVRNGTVSIYYGASDEVIAGADISLHDIMATLRPVV
ncbi:MAG: glycoside hydrolase family 130 protein [Armatimonadota bacterium]